MSDLALAEGCLKMGSGPRRPSATEIRELENRNRSLARHVRELERRNRDLRRELDGQRCEPGAQLEGMRVVAGAMSHLFNNLMTCIGCSSELLRTKLPARSEGHEHLDVVDQAWQRGSEICQRLMTAAGDAPFAAAELDLNEVVRQAVSVAAADGHRVRLDLAEGSLALAGDTSLLQNLILELIANATEAAGDGAARVSISTGPRKRSATDWRHPGARARLSEPWVCLKVSDNGCGIEPKAVTRIFDPFFTTKFLGRGLGLAVVFGIVEQHRGEITVQSQVGHGSTFRVLLPAAGAASGRPGGVTSMQRSHRLLVADDNPQIGEVLLRWLKSLGHDARLVHDGCEALQACDRELWDLVFMDCQMPGVNGFEATRRLRQRGHLVPVVAFTAMSSAVRSHCLDAGMDDFLQKPCEMAELRAVLRRWLPAANAPPEAATVSISE